MLNLITDIETFKIGEVINIKGHSYRNGKRWSGFVTHISQEGITISTNNRRSNIFVDFNKADFYRYS